MLNIVKHCFPAEYAAWRPRIREMIPSHDIMLHQTPELLDEIRTHTAKVLGLKG